MTHLITTDLLLVCNQKYFSRTPKKATNVSQRNNKVFSLTQKKLPLVFVITSEPTCWNAASVFSSLIPPSKRANSF